MSFVSPEAQIAESAEIGPFVTIERNVVIGEGTRVMSGAVICEGTRIGKNCRIFPIGMHWSLMFEAVQKKKIIIL